MDEYIYEIPIYDGRLKNWRVLNLNTLTFYSPDYKTEGAAAASVAVGEDRGNGEDRVSTVKLVNRAELLTGLDLLTWRER